ncbi:MAG: choice-of-anchor D domain-containing protein [Deltaproteobacteria bacterium]|nr:choice-of-anchor D domain-containing protein [Deltaproteobacteria bacterium]
MKRHRIHTFTLLVVAAALGAGCGGSTAPDGGQPCTQDFECAVGEYCKDGICTSYGADEGPRTCDQDIDCREGEICEGGVCVAGSRPDGGVDGGADGADAGGDLPAGGPRIVLGGDVVVFQDSQGTTWEINFGNVSVGTEVCRNLAVRNGGDETLEVSVITIDRDPNSEFSSEPGVPPALEIEVGGERTVEVCYRAADGLTDRAVAKVFSNDPEHAQIDVQLVSEFKGEAHISLDPLLLDFGDLPVGQSASLPLLVSNLATGNAVLRLDAVTVEAAIASAFSVEVRDPDGQTISLPAYLNRDDFVEAEVTFLAPARSSYAGDLIVMSSDEAASPATVALRARAGLPELTVEPASLDFGEVQVGSTAEAAITLRNIGNGDLLISSVELTPAGDIQILGSPGAPFEIAPDGSEDIRIGYQPGEEGQDLATLVIEHDDPDQPTVQVACGGTGIRGNARPTAVIEVDGQAVEILDAMLGEQVDLDGGSSFDSDGSVTEYAWRIIEQPAEPCGSPSALLGATSRQAHIVLTEPGLTAVGLMVKDDQEAWSLEDRLEIVVHAAPQAVIWQGGNDSGYVECDLANPVLTFTGIHSSDCGGQVEDFVWSAVEYPGGRTAAPSFTTSGPPAINATFDFDFPGTYRIGLVVLDDDQPPNESQQATFTVLVRGPQSFRVTADWRDMGNEDHHVDVDLHLIKPGCSPVDLEFDPDASPDPNDCHPEKPGTGEGNRNPDWGTWGSPVYQVDNWEDPDGQDSNPSLAPADEISLLDPGQGQYTVFVNFRCHSSIGLSSYLCCDDLCHVIGCPWCIACSIDGQDRCPRRAVGKVRVFVTDWQGTESLVGEKSFNYTADQQYELRQIGVVRWPEGSFN